MTAIFGICPRSHAVIAPRMKESHRRNPTAVRQRSVQRYNSENEHSAVTAMVRIVMLQRWDISGCDADVRAMFTLV